MIKFDIVASLKELAAKCPADKNGTVFHTAMHAAALIEAQHEHINNLTSRINAILDVQRDVNDL